MRILSTLKMLFVPKNKIARRIKFGPLKNIYMELNLADQTQIYLGLFEREIYQWLIKLSKGINIAIDIGAAGGLYTLYFLAKTNAQRVIAFEPDQKCQDQLEANFKLNGFHNSERFILVKKPVGSVDTSMECTLNSFIKYINGPCIMKMDIDGAEINALNGCSEVLKLNKVAWIVETHSRQLEAECIKIFKQEGFDVQIIKNAWWRIFIPELRPIIENRWLVAFKRS